MKIAIKVVCFLLVLFVSIPVNADSYHPGSAVSIKDVSFFSAKDLIYPELQGVVLIEFEVPIPWTVTPPSPSTCATRIIAIDKDDKHLISVALTALTTSTPIRFAVNNEQKVREYCYARYLKMEK